MARTVADAATLLAAIAETQLDVRLDPAALRGARIGVARNLAGFHPGVDALFEDALDALRAQGAEVIDPADVPHATDLQEPEWELLKYEFKTDLEVYLSAVGGEVPRTLADLIAFNAAHADVELALFGQEVFEQAAEKGPLTEPAYTELLATCGRLSREEGLDAVLAEHRLDAVVAPSGSPAWLIDHVLGDHYVGGNSSPAAVSGYPSITVPMGAISGLPVGVSFTGPAWSEDRLIGVAFAFEQATAHRRAPTFRTTIAPSEGYSPSLVEHAFHRAPRLARHAQVVVDERLSWVLLVAEASSQCRLLLRRRRHGLGVQSSIDLERVLHVRQEDERLTQVARHALLHQVVLGQMLDRVERPVRPQFRLRAAEPHQRDLDRELHVGERSHAELEMELRGLGRLHALALDPFAHPADLGHAVDGDAVGRVREVSGVQLEPPPELLVARDEPDAQQRLELPEIRVSLPVFEVAGERARQRAVAALGTEVRVRLPSGVADPAHHALRESAGRFEVLV